MLIEDLRSFLAGRWNISRRISDQRASVAGRFIGEATFTAVDSGLRYAETGSLTLGTHHQQATRAYVYTFDGPRRADVWFDGGGYFHPLDLGEGRCRVRHVCADDTYDGAFRVVRRDAWNAVWRVTGPRKNYVLRTRYRRLDQD